MGLNAYMFVKLSASQEFCIGLSVCWCTSILYFIAVPSKVSTLSVSRLVQLSSPALNITYISPAIMWSTKQVHLVEDGRKRVPGSITQTNIVGLTAGATYRVRVRAISSIGEGEYSKLKEEIPYRGK